MTKVGFDLGTTYSAFCIYDEQNQKVDYLKFDTCTRDFFPTLLAFNKKDPTRRYIGEAARLYRFSTNYDVYDTFKLSLGEGIDDRKDRDKTTFETAQSFIREVLNKLKENRDINLNEIVLVQTVPDIWKNETHNQEALKHLADVYAGLGLNTESQVLFESEPVAAAVYYLNEICQGNYNGSILVVDYGGGTLDLTLCRAEKNGSISVLCSCGNGGSEEAGCAGKAFDRAMTIRLIQKYLLDESIYTPGQAAFDSLLNAFENCKIASTERTRTALKEYYGSGGSDDKIAFSVLLPPSYEEYDVYTSDIAQVFDEVNRQVLEDAILKMQENCRSMDIDIGSTEDFRLLLVGGFSNLYCVENCVRELFGSVSGSEDSRFDEQMNRESRSTAIAHGACLIAAGVTPVVYLNQTEMGFYAYNLHGQEEAFPILQRGKSVKDYIQPVFSPYKFRSIFHEMPVSLSLYFDDGIVPFKIIMDELFQDLCPNWTQKDNVYQIGFSIDRHRIPHLHIRDIRGEENVFSLFKIISRLPAIVIHEETVEMEKV